MKDVDVKYSRPANIEEASSLLAESERALAVAGGQSLLPALRRDEIDADHLVDLSHLDGHRYIWKTEGTLRIGCLVRYVDVATSSTVRSGWPTLADAVGRIGDRQVRHRGTFCGGLAEASRMGDPPVLALVLDVDLATTSTSGTRRLDATDFFTGDSTALRDDELVAEAIVPASDRSRRVAHERYTPTNGAYPVALVAIAADCAGERVENPRVAVGGACPPRRLTSVERWLDERELDERMASAVAERVGDAVDPVEDFEGSEEFKTTIMERLARRAFETVLEGDES